MRVEQVIYFDISPLHFSLHRPPFLLQFLRIILPFPDLTCINLPFFGHPFTFKFLHLPSTLLTLSLSGLFSPFLPYTRSYVFFQSSSSLPLLSVPVSIRIAKPPSFDFLRGRLSKWKEKLHPLFQWGTLSPWTIFLSCFYKKRTLYPRVRQ